MKTCTKCGVSKLEADFSPDSRRSDGLQSQCRECKNAYKRARYANDPDYREPYKAAKRAYYASNPDYQERTKAYSKTERAKETRRQYSQTARAKQLASKHSRARWSKIRLDPEAKAKIRARRAIRYDIHKGYRPAASELDCAICGKPAAHYHHHLGYADDHRRDVIALCGDCHRSIH